MSVCIWFCVSKLHCYYSIFLRSPPSLPPSLPTSSIKVRKAAVLMGLD